jgi:hypothetical protein
LAGTRVKRKIAPRGEFSVAHSFPPFELSRYVIQSRMHSMRRVAAAFAISVLVSSAALPALAALWCAFAHQDACCARSGDDRDAALERAPCCKVAGAVKDATRQQVAPPVSSGWAIAAPAPMSSHPIALIANAPLPACMQGPVSPPLGPPLRLRI